MNVRRILVPVDGSRLAEAALPAACSLAQTPGARLLLLHGLGRDAPALMLGCGPASVRVRPALTVSVEELDRGVEALDRVLSALGV